MEVWQASNVRPLRLGEEKKRKKERKKEDRNHRMKIYMVSLLHRATINKGQADVPFLVVSTLKKEGICLSWRHLTFQLWGHVKLQDYYSDCY